MQQGLSIACGFPGESEEQDENSAVQGQGREGARRLAFLLKSSGWPVGCSMTAQCADTHARLICGHGVGMTRGMKQGNSASLCGLPNLTMGMQGRWRSVTVLPT